MSVSLSLCLSVSLSLCVYVCWFSGSGLWGVTLLVSDGELVSGLWALVSDGVLVSGLWSLVSDGVLVFQSPLWRPAMPPTWSVLCSGTGRRTW